MKGTLYSSVGRLNIKMTVLPKAIYRVNAIPNEVATAFFTEMKKPILRFIWNLKGACSAPSSLHVAPATLHLHAQQFRTSPAHNQAQTSSDLRVKVYKCVCC